MVRNTSLADHMADWRRLLNLLEVNVKEGWIPDMPALRTALQETLAHLERSVAQQDSIRAESKDNAQETRTLVRSGSDMALQLRAAVRFHLGPRNPLLAEFRVRVLSPRRPKPSEPEKKAEPTARRRQRRAAKAEAEGEPEPKEPEPAA
jgi:ribosomal protein S21